MRNLCIFFYLLCVLNKSKETTFIPELEVKPHHKVETFFQNLVYISVSKFQMLFSSIKGVSIQILKSRNYCERFLRKSKYTYKLLWMILGVYQSISLSSSCLFGGTMFHCLSKFSKSSESRVNSQLRDTLLSLAS